MTQDINALVQRVLEESIRVPIPAGGIQGHLGIASDLGIDSIGLIGVCFLIDQELPGDLFTRVEELTAARTVDDLVAIAATEASP